MTATQLTKRKQRISVLKVQSKLNHSVIVIFLFKSLLLFTIFTYIAVFHQLQFERNSLKMKACDGELCKEFLWIWPQTLRERQICVSEHWLTVIRNHCKYGKFHASQMLDVRE